MADVNVIGSLEAKFESTSRIYDVGGCSPTLSTMQGGNQEPKILEVRELGFMDNGTGKHQSNTVYSENGLSPNITTIEGGGTQQIKVCKSQIVAVDEQNMRIRIETYGTLTTDGSSPKHNNRVLEVESSENVAKVGQISNANPHICTEYRIRKLTPRECGRLMGVSDEDIDKMAAVNSNTQLYRQFGNSIVVQVMCAMFKNLNINQGDTVMQQERKRQYE